MLRSIVDTYTVCVILGTFSHNLTRIRAFSNVPYMLIQLSGIDRLNATTSSRLLSGIESGCSSFLVHHHAVLDFLDIFMEAHDRAAYRNPNKYVLLLMEDPVPDNLLESIRGHVSMREIINLILFEPTHDRSSVELLTHRFVNAEQDFEWYRVDRYDIQNHSFESENQLFPDKTDDLRGKPIRVATFNVNPHIFLIEAENASPIIRSGNQTYSLNGPNGFLLVEFCKRRNCSIELVVGRCQTKFSIVINAIRIRLLLIQIR